MIVIRNWRDMAQFGIEALTGEACAFSMRLLCDVNAEGRALLTTYFGLPGDTELAAPYNSKVNNEPSVGSVMLEHGLESLATFTLRRAGMKLVVVRRHEATGNMVEVVGFTDDEFDDSLYYMASLALNQSVFVRREVSPCVTRGDRNIHQMTGRVL